MLTDTARPGDTSSPIETLHSLRFDYVARKAREGNHCEQEIVKLLGYLANSAEF